MSDWERVTVTTGRKGMPLNIAKVGKNGLSFGPDLFEGRDLEKLRLEPYIRKAERLIGFKVSRNGYKPRRTENGKCVMLQCKGTLNLLDPAPRHRAVYSAKWEKDMLVVDFTAEAS